MATRDAELFKDKVEILLDGRQIFYLFFGGAVIACLVFVLGVTVGRRVEARANPPRASAAVNDPLAALDELDARSGGELAFPAALRGADDVPLGSVDERAARGELKPAPPLPSRRDSGKPVERAAAPEAAPQPASPSAAAAGAPAAGLASQPAAGASLANDTKSAGDTKGAEPASDTKPAKKDTKPADAARPPGRSATAGSGKFTLQLSSFQDRAEAAAFLAQVKQAGYAPYMVQAEVEGKGTWYRIRVGDYPSFEAAIAAKAEFEGKQQIIAYVTRLK